MRLSPRRTAVAVAGALALTPAVAAAQAPALAPLVGDATCEYGAAACNPPAPGLVDQFRILRDHGDPMGFHLGRAPDVSLTRHWQGIQRVMSGDARHLVVSRSGARTGFAIVRMGSRIRGGERFRSNRIGNRTAIVEPPQSDVVVTTRSSPLGMDHAGGIQLIGEQLVVGFEGDRGSRVEFWGMRDPERPLRHAVLPHETGVKGAGTVSIARLRDGRYLLIVGGANANALDFYVTRPGTGSPAAARWTHVATWRESQLRSEIPGDREFGNYQNLNLLMDERGALFLIGTHKDSVRNTDWADLYRLDTAGDAVPRITKIAKRHLYCAIPSVVLPANRVFGGRQCDLDAAGGAYVSRRGRLLLYATEHDNDGPGGTIKAMEFRGAPHRTTCANDIHAWVELYDDSGFDGDRSLMIDFVDHTRRDYDNYDRAEGFEDKASAAMWCLPRGWRYRLYEHKGGCRGRTVDLIGTGRPERDPDFGDRRGAVRRFGDKTSCSRWIAP